MRRALPYLLAFLLGTGAALLAACGESTNGGIPAAAAEDLKGQIGDVRERVESGRCEEISGQLRQIDDRIDGLPSSVDEQLRRNLYDAAGRLRSRAPTECNDNSAATQTETAPDVTETQTATEPVPTQTTTTETTTIETTPTETAPTPTTPPTTPPVDPPAPLPPPPPPPPITPGGGTPPEIP